MKIKRAIKNKSYYNEKNKTHNKFINYNAIYYGL